MTGRRFSLVGVPAVLIVLSVFSHSRAGVIYNFTDYYHVSLWNVVVEGSGSVDTTGEPLSLELIGSDDQSNNLRNVDFTRVAPADGWVSFNWAYETWDDDGSQMDPFGYLLPAVFDQLSTNYDGAGPRTQTGTASFFVLAGQEFGFRVASLDDIRGRAETIISNFSGPAPLSLDPIPEPSTFVLLGLALAGLGFRRHRRRCRA